jgi:hypothetical protein
MVEFKTLVYKSLVIVLDFLLHVNDNHYHIDAGK